MVVIALRCLLVYGRPHETTQMAVVPINSATNSSQSKHHH